MKSRSQIIVALGLLTSLSAAQSAAARFDAPIVVGGDYTRFTNTLDLDGDGWKDAMSFWYSPSGDLSVQAWRNDHTGKLTFAWSMFQTLGSWSLADVDIATGDMNLDGRDDFVLGVGGTLYFYLSSGTGPPTPWGSASAGGTVLGVQMADFNGDGRADIAYLGTFGVGVMLVQASGPPFPTSSLGIPFGTSYHLFLAEVNGDGVKDIGLTTTTTGTFVQLFPVVGGVIQAPTLFVLPFETMPMPVAGDIDNDGDEDIIVFSSSSYRVLRRTGPATFNLEPYVPGGPATGLADVDNDGDLDGVCCGGGGGGAGPVNLYPSVFEISTNKSGVFAQAFTIPGLGSLRLAGAVDLDQDGDVDLVGGRCVYYPDGPITKAPLTTVGTIFQNPRSVIDVDNDGDPDAQPGIGPPSYPFFRNTGDGVFTASPLPLPAAPAGTVFVGPGWPGDFDGDGDVDFVVVQQATGGSFVAMRLLRNAGGGGFKDGGNAGIAGQDFRLIMSSPSSPVQLDADSSLAADADGDGDLDLILRAAVGYYVASKVWLNNGSGVFVPGQELFGSYVEAVANFDVDPRPDLIVAFNGGISFAGPLRLCRGLGSGVFAPPDVASITSAVSFTDRCAVKDLDGDGDLDLVAPNGNAVFVGVNDGNGNFFAAVPAITGAIEGSTGSTRYVFVTDVNVDGIADIIAEPVLGTAGGGASILLGTGTPFSFQPPIVQLVGSGTFVDIDGDGDPDGLGTKIARNRRFSIPADGLRRQYGTGLAGSGGMIPSLGAVGPFRSGLSGQTRITGGLGGAYAVFGIGLQEANTPLAGGTLLIVPEVTFGFYLGGAPGIPGVGSMTLTWTAYPWLVGTAFYQQVGIVDPGAPQGGSLTNGLHSVIGP